MLATVHKWSIITLVAAMVGNYAFQALRLGSWHVLFAVVFAYVWVRVVFSLIGDDQL